MSERTFAGYVGGISIGEPMRMRDPTTTAVSHDDEDEVARASLDSFPASDPPGWSGLRLGPPASQVRREHGQTDHSQRSADAIDDQHTEHTEHTR
jgi:hypothetical protein